MVAMRIHLNPSHALVLLLSCGALIAAERPPATAAPGVDQPTMEELQRQVDTLDQELTRLKGANDLTVQQQAMQQHWSMMQEHMRSLRMMPGMEPSGCADWMMMDWNMMDPSTMTQSGDMGCGMRDHWMMGHGTGSEMMGWGMPSSMTPGDYQRQMQERMARIRKQMNAIRAAPDPAKRLALMREHYETMYRDMQTTRGMGWMWMPNAAASLAESKSHGASLVAQYCSQCHAMPSPSLHTQEEWSQVTSRMRQHIDDQSSGSGMGVKMPSASELNAITDYLGKHANDAR